MLIFFTQSRSIAMIVLVLAEPTSMVNATFPPYMTE
jgi:hypothetical protein